MEDITQLLRRTIGLRKTDRITKVAGEEAPARHIGYGLACGDSETQLDMDSVPLAELLEGPVRAAPSFSDVALSGLDPQSARLRRWDNDPAMLFFEWSGVTPHAVGTYHATGDRELAIDCRQDPAVIQFHQVDQEYALTCVEGEVALLQIHRGPPQQLAESERAEEPSSPSLLDLLDGQSCERWFAKAYADLSIRMSELGRLAAPGLVARLWSPGASGESARILEALLEGGSTPVDRALRWARSLDVGACLRVEQQAVGDVRQLKRQLARLLAAAELDASVVLGTALAILHARDDLESVLCILKTAGCGNTLVSALDAFDHAALASVDHFKTVDGIGDDDRLHAVAWQEPEAWWGDLVGD